MVADGTGIYYYQVGIRRLGNDAVAHIGKCTRYALAVRFILLTTVCYDAGIFASAYHRGNASRIFMLFFHFSFGYDSLLPAFHLANKDLSL